MTRYKNKVSGDECRLSVYCVAIFFFRHHFCSMGQWMKGLQSTLFFLQSFLFDF